MKPAPWITFTATVVQLDSTLGGAMRSDGPTGQFGCRLREGRSGLAGVPVQAGLGFHHQGNGSCGNSLPRWGGPQVHLRHLAIVKSAQRRSVGCRPKNRRATRTTTKSARLAMLHAASSNGHRLRKAHRTPRDFPARPKLSCRVLRCVHCAELS
jgi:hypothetical protein